MSSSVFGSILTLLVIRETEGKREEGKKGRRKGDGGGRQRYSLSKLTCNSSCQYANSIRLSSSLWAIVNLSSILKNLIYAPTLI